MINTIFLLLMTIVTITLLYYFGYKKRKLPEYETPPIPIKPKQDIIPEGSIGIKTIYNHFFDCNITLVFRCHNDYGNKVEVILDDILNISTSKKTKAVSDLNCDILGESKIILVKDGIQWEKSINTNIPVLKSDLIELIQTGSVDIGGMTLTSGDDVDISSFMDELINKL